MSDENDSTSWGAKERNSYVYADENYAKLATIAGGSAVAVDPASWSYAETNSYVKVDPGSIGIEAPSSVTELYAKVIFVPGGVGGGSSSGSFTERDPVFRQVSGLFATKALVSSMIPSAVSQLGNDAGFVTSGFVASQVSAAELELAAEIEETRTMIPSAMSQLQDANDYATRDWVTLHSPLAEYVTLTVTPLVSALSSDMISVSSALVTKTSQLENDSEFATSSFVVETAQSMIPAIEDVMAQYATIDFVWSIIPTNVSFFSNDTGYVTSRQVEEMLSGQEPAAPSGLSEWMQSVNLRLARLEASAPLGMTVMPGRSEDGSAADDLVIGGRQASDSLADTIDYGSR